jgi:AcrR family transcriptional regulator
MAGSRAHPKLVAPARALRARRLSRETRRANIIIEAIKLTAEVGYVWQTRDLARRLNVAQPLMFRYFKTKQQLLDVVFEEVYIKRWNPSWELTLADDSMPIKQRLLTFYKSYTQTIFDYTWIRIYHFSGLMGHPLNKTYVQLLSTKILKNICVQIKRASGIPIRRSNPTARDIEIAWQIHSGLFYYGVRKFVYRIPVAQQPDEIIENTVCMLMAQVSRAGSAERD